MQTQKSPYIPHISKSKSCPNVKSSRHYSHMKMKILADFEIYISAPVHFESKLIRDIYCMGAMQFYRFVCMIVVQAHISLMTRLVVMPPCGFMAKPWWWPDSKVPGSSKGLVLWNHLLLIKMYPSQPVMKLVQHIFFKSDLNLSLK